MADTDLVFAAPASSSADLVFGSQGDSGIQDAPVTILVSLLPAVHVHVTPPAPMSVSMTLAPVVTVDLTLSLALTVSATMPALAVQVRPSYVSGAQRPTVSATHGLWQVTDRIETGAEHRMQIAQRQPVNLAACWQTASGRAAGARNRHSAAQPTRAAAGTSFQGAARADAAPAVARHQDAMRGSRLSSTTRFQGGAPAGVRTTLRHQDGLRDRRNRTAAAWQQGMPHSLQQTESAGPALWLNIGWLAEYQEAMRPRAGTSPVITPPNPHQPCYTPPPGGAVNLLFADPQLFDPNLLFACPISTGPEPVTTVVVPIKRVYVVLNESSLRRVDGNIFLPTFSMAMSLDVDSWTWSFSAALPGEALADLEPGSPGEPVLVEAMINGVAYQMQIERRSRDRSFAANGLKISGRGLAATLDTPYAPTMTFTNDSARTAQQLMNDVLTLNGVSIGWEIDWRAVDWSIPAGVFAHQGSYISALNTIAAAAGSYLQPHATDQVLRVLPRYPTAPWAWGALTPDYEIPSAVATTEGIEWLEKAIYNRVFVSGVQSGVLGQVTRAGTDGGLVAPMVTDALITTAAAARQRATPVLADTGSQAQVTLKMPVLAETGIIAPGKFVRYTDGDIERVGLSRGVSVDVQHPETWQTLLLETHV